ncbi:substrate-binding domain-containing protein [Enterovibrio paralichthyis]|uniref:substrate-binding domain-containing protein n=1 Tax=Enterovibrio paralichthyis TaxID=2853805 RepID=UPI001C4608C6|nr:substrate-binding domain-containing protein [Enterovibrio paralichthyis]MBV7297239.1 substrate-binding domain-containing protein [Enterovibrio paralichthyis]
MATIKDVARVAGVSVATVSRVINGSPQTRPDTVALVKKTMQQLGYRPNAAARTLVTKKNRAIGVVVADVADPFFGTLVKHVDTIAHAQGYHVLIGNGYHNAEREKQTIESLIQNQVGSLIIHSKALDDDTLRKYAEEHSAVVFINRHIPGLAGRCIYLDNYHGAYLATEHLIGKGHKHIGYLGSNHGIEDTEQRYHGFHDALKAHGLLCESGTDETRCAAQGIPDETGGELAMASLLEKMPSVTAVFCYNDVMAAGAVSLLTERKIHVPQEVSVVGFDNSAIARYMYPKLTTVRYPIEEMAAKAATLAISLADNQPAPALDSNYKPSLVLRDSVSSPATDN